MCEAKRKQLMPNAYTESREELAVQQLKTTKEFSSMVSSVEQVARKTKESYARLDKELIKLGLDPALNKELDMIIDKHIRAHQLVADETNKA